MPPASPRTRGIPLERIGPPPIVAAYVAGEAAATRFFVGDPFSKADRLAAAARASAPDRDRGLLADIVAEQNAGWGAPAGPARAAVEARVEALRDPQSVAVVTGQQPGLFGGPLFTILKALTAVRLAARMQEETGHPTVPVFWIADEDHDFAEMHHTAVVVDGRLTRLTYEDGGPPEENRGAVGRLVLGAGIERTLDDLEAAALRGPFAAGLLAVMREVWQPGERWRDAFARTLRTLLPDAPLVLFSSDDTRVKRLASTLFAAECEDWMATHAAHESRTAGLEEAGFVAQVEPRPLHLFRLDHGRRLALDPVDAGDPEAGVVVRATGEQLSRRQLADLARSTPEMFSPDVVLRPVTQDTLLPTATYVAGPGELAYFAQLGGVYDRFGVSMPLIAPRATMTLVEPAIRRAMDELGIDAEDVISGVSVRAALEREAPAVDGALSEAEKAVDEALDGARAAVQSLDASLERAAGAAAARARKALATLRLKAERVARRRGTDEQLRLARVEGALRPAGKLQERALSGLGLYARYGPSLGMLIEQAIDVDARGHVVVDLP